ncbi:MAG: glycerophosphodiester phosphodiesterase family protein [Thalassobaculales bacterium]
MTAIAAHRGGALLWPENSRIAFENAARLPVDQVEFDIHPSRDGELVVIHDAMLERTTDGEGPVAERDWAGLSRLTLNHTGGQGLLRLEELCDIFRPTAITLRLEIKADRREQRYPGLEARVLAALAAAGMAGRTVITSFHAETVAEVARAGPAMRPIWLVAPLVQRALGLARCIAVAGDIGAGAIGLRGDLADAGAVAAIRAAGLSPGCWAVNTPAAIAAALALGVDVFTTDRPDLALALRAAARG